jgi:hypothetical protein
MCRHRAGSSGGLRVPKTLAAHHGSVIGSKVDVYLRALREHDVCGLTEWNPMRGS